MTKQEQFIQYLEDVVSLQNKLINLFKISKCKEVAVAKKHQAEDILDKFKSIYEVK